MKQRIWARFVPSATTDGWPDPEKMADINHHPVLSRPQSCLLALTPNFAED